MKLKNILKNDKISIKMDDEMKKKLEKMLSAPKTCKELLEFLAETGIILYYRVYDKFGRNLLVTPFGAYERPESNHHLDKLDAGLVSCGVFSKKPSLIYEVEKNFHYMAEWSVDLITTKNMLGYVLVDETSLELDMAVDDFDVDAFERELKRVKISHYIPSMEIKEVKA